MGYKGKGKVGFSGQFTLDRKAYLIARAERLVWTETKAATRIMDMWFEAGCPPLSEADALLPRLVPEWEIPAASPNSSTTRSPVDREISEQRSADGVAGKNDTTPKPQHIPQDVRGAVGNKGRV